MHAPHIELVFAHNVRTIAIMHFFLFLLQLTLLNAGRKYLGVNSLSGKVFLTSGLGGMSGAQPKASVNL